MFDPKQQLRYSSEEGPYRWIPRSGVQYWGKVERCEDEREDNTGVKEGTVRLD